MTINRLETLEFADFAKRLRYPDKAAEEGKGGIKPASLRVFATLATSNRGMHLPQVTITTEGPVQAVGRHRRQGTLVVTFQESGNAAFTLLHGR